MLLIAAARPIAIGQRWHHCYKYCSMPWRLPWTNLALCKAWQSTCHLIVHEA